MLYSHQSLTFAISLRWCRALHLQELHNEHIQRKDYQVIPRESQRIRHIRRHQPHRLTENVRHTFICKCTTVQCISSFLHANTYKIIYHCQQNLLTFLLISIINSQQPCTTQPCVKRQDFYSFVLSIYRLGSSFFNKKSYTFLQQPY